MEGRRRDCPRRPFKNESEKQGIGELRRMRRQPIPFSSSELLHDPEGDGVDVFRGTGVCFGVSVRIVRVNPVGGCVEGRQFAQRIQIAHRRLAGIHGEFRVAACFKVAIAEPRLDGAVQRREFNPHVDAETVDAARIREGGRLCRGRVVFEICV